MTGIIVHGEKKEDEENVGQKSWERWQSWVGNKYSCAFAEKTKTFLLFGEEKHIEEYEENVK